PRPCVRAALSSFPTRRSSDLKVRQGLSAGRVQSVATRMVVERERERMAFRAASYWDVEGQFAPQSAAGSTGAFSARLTGVDGRRDRKSTRLNSSHVSISYAVF